MNLLVSKINADQRKAMCGVMIPDGFFTVVEYTEETQPQLSNIKRLHKDNYKVTKTDLPAGWYAPNGCRVTLGSLWDWYLYKKPLVYIDGDPVSGVPIPTTERPRPPNMSARPEYIGLADIGEDPVDLPPAVALARKQLAENVKPVAPVAHTIASDIPTESDQETLLAAGATDEVAMLRAQLDAKGIRYHPTAQAPALRKKLA